MSDEQRTDNDAPDDSITKAGAESLKQWGKDNPYGDEPCPTCGLPGARWIEGLEQGIKTLEQQIEDERMRHHVHDEAERKKAVERQERIEELVRERDSLRTAYKQQLIPCGECIGGGTATGHPCSDCGATGHITPEEYVAGVYADVDPVLRAAIRGKRLKRRLDRLTEGDSRGIDTNAVSRTLDEIKIAGTELFDAIAACQRCKELDEQ